MLHAMSMSIRCLFFLVLTSAGACAGDPPPGECTDERRGMCLPNPYGGEDCCGVCPYSCCVDGMIGTCLNMGYECNQAPPVACGGGTCVNPGELCPMDGGRDGAVVDGSVPDAPAVSDR
jgi:hypothetical protein